MMKLALILIFTLTTLSDVAECFAGVRIPVSHGIGRISSAGRSAILKDISRNPTSAVRTIRSSTSLQSAPVDILVSMYKDSLMDNPLATKIITGGILALMGDAIAQSTEPEYDQTRATAFISFDMFYRAVQCALFPIIVDICDGHFLSQLFPAMLDVNIHYLATMEQTIANQFLVIPFIYYPVFFTLTGYLQGLTIDDTIERAQTTLIPLLKRNWLFWIPVQFFQFGYVDEPLQIPFLCVAGLAWTFILSTYAGSVKKAPIVVEEEGPVPRDGIKV